MVIVRDNPTRHRYEITDGDVVIGFLDYVRTSDRITLTHAETDRAHRGAGVARQLVTAALDDLRARGLAVLPQCTYVRMVIADEANRFLDLVPVDERARFGLPVT